VGLLGTTKTGVIEENFVPLAYACLWAGLPHGKKKTGK